MPGRATFNLKVLVDAVRRCVDETSIRAVADEIGMSPSGLHVLLGGSKPHPATRQKLVLWYVERQKTDASGRDEISPRDVDAAMRLLVLYAKQGSAEARNSRVREIIRRFEVETGMTRKDDR